MSNTCPRCEKTNPAEIHTCTPTLEWRVIDLESMFHDMAEKMWTRIEMIEEKISHLFEVTNE
jgi:hypothetical protein